MVGIYAEILRLRAKLKRTAQLRAAQCYGNPTDSKLLEFGSSSGQAKVRGIGTNDG